MPGKINPVMAELAAMVSFQVVGNDMAVAMAVQAGQLELNVMMPAMAYNVLQSMTILANMLRVFTERCVRGHQANEARCRQYAESTIALATALNPLIGYAKAAELVKESVASGELDCGAGAEEEGAERCGDRGSARSHEGDGATRAGEGGEMTAKLSDEARCWPALPFDSWKDTCETLHMWTQVVGKVRLALTPLVNHWWNVPLYVTARGLTTSRIPYGARAFELTFDFLARELVLETSEGTVKKLALEPQTVADFYRDVHGDAAGRGD